MKFISRGRGMFKVFACGKVARSVVELISGINKMDKFKKISEDSEEYDLTELESIKYHYLVISNKKSKSDYMKRAFEQEDRDFEILELNSIHTNRDEKSVEKVLQGQNIVFILGDIRDKHSVYKMELISKIAKRKSILCIAMALVPHFIDKAEEVNCYREVEDLANKFDTFIPVLAEKMAYYGNISYEYEEGGEHGESIMLFYIKPLIDVIACEGPIKFDRKDFEAILKDQGLAFIAVAEENGENKIEITLERMLKAYEACNIVSLRKAKKIFVSIEFGNDISLESINEISEKIQSCVRKDADIIFTAIKKDEPEEYFKVAVVGTGF